MEHLNNKDMEDIANFLEQSECAKMLRELNTFNFNVGDILVRYQVNYDGKEELCLVSKACPIAKKYKVVFIDELNIPWVKQLKMRGGLGTKLYCLASYASRYKWRIDPARIDALLLDADYNPRAEYREMRNSNPEYGKSK